MKKIILLTLILILGAVIYASTVTHPVSAPSAESYFSDIKSLKATFDADVNNVTIAVGKLYGSLERISIDSTGSDGSYKVYVNDSVGVVWSKTDCNTANDPQSFPLTMTNGTNVFKGIPITGAVSVQIADANDSSMTDLDIYLYYK